jgi:enoyl-CoA hydratase/carnithine racemase
VRVELSQGDGYPRLSTALLADLEERLDSLLCDPACSALVIHGNDRCFAAGAEVAEVAGLTGAAALTFSRRTQLLFDRLGRSPKPVVAAVAGYCLGGGFDLALACQWRTAAPGAVFGHPGATLGLLTGWGGTQRLPRLVGRSRALELLLTGRQVSAPEALAIGLVDEVVSPDTLLCSACDRAAALAGG